MSKVFLSLLPTIQVYRYSIYLVRLESSSPSFIRHSLLAAGSNGRGRKRRCSSSAEACKVGLWHRVSPRLITGAYTRYTCEDRTRSHYDYQDASLYLR